MENSLRPDTLLNRSQASLGAGMVQLLTPLVQQCDLRLKAVLDAQKALTAQIELFSSGTPRSW